MLHCTLVVSVLRHIVGDARCMFHPFNVQKASPV